MLGDFTSRIALQILGYAWPAYACFKDVHANNTEKMKLWCIYWMLLAGFTAIQPLADTFLFFLPLYYEAKLAFVVYMWYPALSGAQHLYHQYAEPFIIQHEPLVDRRLEDGKKLLGSWAAQNASRAVQWAQNMVINLLRQTQHREEAAQPLKAEPAGQTAPAAETGGLFSQLSSGLSFSTPVNSGSFKSYSFACKDK